MDACTRLYDLATARAPMALLGAALCFFNIAAVISVFELLLLKLSPLLLKDEPREHLSQFYTLCLLHLPVLSKF